MSEPTNKELRRRIAKLLGYYIGTVEDDEFRFALYDPKNNICGLTHTDDFSVIRLVWYDIPNWSEDLNAAARDLLTQMPEFGLYWLPEAKQWGIYNPMDSFMLEVSSNPARAICLAFVAMHKEKANE